jgi:hypothetical protein
MIDYKYNEEALINELQEYVDSTYQEHYSQNKFQATEFIIDGGHGEGFALGNILKYSQRYGKKAGKNRNDLLKVLHYALIALHVHDKEHADPIPEQTDREKISEWDEGGQDRVPVKVTTSDDVTHVLVTKCPDKLKWYADKVGAIVEVFGVYGDEYKARDNGGYTNFISMDDASPVDPLV